MIAAYRGGDRGGVTGTSGEDREGDPSLGLLELSRAACQASCTALLAGADVGATERAADASSAPTSAVSSSATASQMRGGAMSAPTHRHQAHPRTQVLRGPHYFQQTMDTVTAGRTGKMGIDSAHGTSCRLGIMQPQAMLAEDKSSRPLARSTADFRHLTSATAKCGSTPPTFRVATPSGGVAPSAMGVYDRAKERGVGAGGSGSGGFGVGSYPRRPEAPPPPGGGRLDRVRRQHQTIYAVCALTVALGRPIYPSCTPLVV